MPPLPWGKTHTASINGITRRHKLDSRPPNTEANFQSAGLSLFSAYAGGEMTPLTGYSTIHHVLDARVQKGGVPSGSKQRLNWWFMVCVHITVEATTAQWTRNYITTPTACSHFHLFPDVLLVRIKAARHDDVNPLHYIILFVLRVMCLTWWSESNLLCFCRIKTAAMDFTNPISSFWLAFTADCKSALLYINGTK